MGLAPSLLCIHAEKVEVFMTQNYIMKNLILAVVLVLGAQSSYANSLAIYAGSRAAQADEGSSGVTGVTGETGEQVDENQVIVNLVPPAETIPLVEIIPPAPPASPSVDLERSVDPAFTKLTSNKSDDPSHREEKRKEKDKKDRDSKDSSSKESSKEAVLPQFASINDAIEGTLQDRVNLINRFSQKIAEKKSKDVNFSLSLSCSSSPDQYSSTQEIFNKEEKRINKDQKKSKWRFFNPISWAKGGFKIAKAMFSWPFSKIGKNGEAQIGKVKGPRVLGFDDDTGKVVLGFDVSMRAVIDASDSDKVKSKKMDVKSYQLCTASKEDLAAMSGKDLNWVDKKLKIGKYAKKDKKSDKDSNRSVEVRGEDNREADDEIEEATDTAASDQETTADLAS